MNRRQFLSALAAARAAVAALVTGQPPLRKIDPEADEFACEIEARKVEANLGRLLETRSLPLASFFQGTSPMPVGWRTVAEGVQRAEYNAADHGFEQGLRAWIESLGPVRTSAFYALPGDWVRFEIASAGAYRVGLWKQVWRDGKLAEFAPHDEILVRSDTPFFADVTAHSFGSVPSFRDQLAEGNTFWRARLDAAAGIDIYGSNGIAVGDIDGDGWDEVYVCQQGGLPNRLYKNRGDGSFEDITEAAGLAILDDSTSALFLDLRNTGHQDLVVLRGAGPLLFLNDGRGKFTEQPNAFRFRNAPQGSFTGMAAADYDRDGKLDLYLCCYVYFQSEDQYRYPLPYHDAQNGPPNFLFQNKLADGGFFEDVTDATGLNHNNNRYSFAPAWCDFDGDGWPDLYVANDFGRNNLYRNRGGKFRDEAAEAGVEDLGPGMSATWLDYDGDGRMDLYVSNMWSAPGQRIVHDPAFKPAAALPDAYRRHTKGNSLYRNRGDGRFEDTGAREGVEMGRWAWSADAFDFDNDGTPEIYVTSGMLSHPLAKQDLRSFFWRQVVAKSPLVDAPAPDYENGWNAINQLVREDYAWCGGDTNVFYVRPKPEPGEPARYYDCSGISGLDFADDSRAFAAIDLDGDGNLDLILKSRQGPQIRALRNNRGAGKRVAVFKLRGTKSNRDAIGARVEVNGRVQFVKAGTGYLSQHTKDLHFALLDTPSADVNIVWPSGETQHLAGLQPGFKHHVEEGSSQVRSEPLKPRRPWAASAPVQANNLPAPTDTWLLEPVPLPEPHKGPGLLEITDLSGQYGVFRRYIFEYRAPVDPPLILLLDEHGQARKLYSRRPSRAELQADLTAEARPLPFPGRYFIEPHRSYFKLGAAFYWAGYPAQAVPYLEKVIERNPANWKALNAIARIQLDGDQAAPALSNYRKVLSLKPANGPALVGAGEALVKLNTPAEAAPFFERALEADPNDSDAANQLGLLHATAGRTAEAKQLFQRAIAAHPDHSGALNNLAVLYVRLGQPSDAIAAFQYGIEKVPDDKTLYMNLGRLYVSLGERAKARGVMQRWLAQNPNDPAALQALRELDSR